MPSRAHKTSKGTGDKGARPGDFTLGSIQSRAAARALLARRFEGRNRRGLTLVTNIPRPGCDEIRIGEWREGDDGTLMRICFLPAGMSIDEAERIVAERGVSRG